MIVPVDNPIITSPYGERMLNGKKQFHYGVDYISETNRFVYSVCDGRVCHDFDYYDHAKRFHNKKHSGGNYVIISHRDSSENLFYVKYLHLDNNFVGNKDVVLEGDKIGTYADVGYSFGAHLHVSVYDENWQVKNPADYF